MFTYNFSKMPLVSMIGKVTEKEGWSHSGRQMSVNMIVFFHEGSCTFKIGNKEYQFNKGDVAIVPKNTQYFPHTSTFCEYTFLHFDGDFLPCDMDKSSVSPFGNVTHGAPSYGFLEVKEDDFDLVFDYKISLGSQAQSMEVMIRKCANAKLSYENKQQLIMSVLFCEIMFHISQSFCEEFHSSSSVPPQVNRIIAYVKKNYTRQISLDDICKDLNVSKQYCMRVFKKHMNTTINDYVIDLRMRHASYLLTSTYMNVNEAADYLGFSGTSYFSRVFKKYYGVSPTKYLE